MNDLRKATKNFGSNSYLGEGGFGCVYKGWMDEATLAPTKPAVGRMVAVKKLKKESFQGHKRSGWQRSPTWASSTTRTWSAWWATAAPTT